MSQTQIQSVLQNMGFPAAQIPTLASQVAPKAKQIQASDNITKFGNLIALAEGTGQAGADAYRIAFGGAKVSDLSKHPDMLVGFTETTGKKNKSSAAGKYQFLKSTWDEMSAKTGVTDFSPASQETNFRQLLKQKKVLHLVENGDFTAAINKLGSTFASLPSSKYKQNKRDWAWIAKTASELGIPGVGNGTMVASTGLTDKAIVEATLPTKEQNQAVAEQQARAIDMQMFDEQAQQVQQAATARRNEIDAMLSAAFKFDSTFDTPKTKLPTEFDSQLMQLIDQA